jgi:thymidylate synthase (FAD)
MTTFAHQIRDDDRYVEYLDHGFVGLINHMGSDETIEFATRMSYGEGTRAVSDRRNLIRYLVRHYHTSPLEMGELVFHMKMPIFVMRQLVRHRTASLNEYSARYSELTDEIYVIPEERVQEQSASNKQGSGDVMGEYEAERIIQAIQKSHAISLDTYRELLDSGLSRELARGVMPTNGYTEVVWKIDLNNFFKTAFLRLDKHAQEEVRVLLEIMFTAAKPLFPIAFQAFEDYQLYGQRLSVFEYEALSDILAEAGITREILLERMAESAERRGQELSKREKSEFADKFFM